jgi:hypothetical protein
MLQHSHSQASLDDFPVELRGAISGLGSRIDNLSPPQKYLAEGILSTIERTGRCSDKQERQVYRLANLSKHRYRGKPYTPPEPVWAGPYSRWCPEASIARAAWPGMDEGSIEEAVRSARHVLCVGYKGVSGRISRYLFCDRDGKDFATIEREGSEYAVRLLMDGKPQGPSYSLKSFISAYDFIHARAPKVRGQHKTGIPSTQRREARILPMYIAPPLPRTVAQISRLARKIAVGRYDRQAKLEIALGTIVQPHLLSRRDLIPLLRRAVREARVTLQHSEAIGENIESRFIIERTLFVTELCLVAERLAARRELQTIRNLQNEEAA